MCGSDQLLHSANAISLACRACSVEMLRTALDKCSEPVTAYNACLQKNPRQPERCQVSTEIMLALHWPLDESRFHLSLLSQDGRLSCLRSRLSGPATAAHV
jgi:hypothetical protein